MTERKKKGIFSGIKHWHVVTGVLVIYDAITIAASYFLALLLRFDFHYSTIPAAVSYTHLTLPTITAV